MFDIGRFKQGQVRRVTITKTDAIGGPVLRASGFTTGGIEFRDIEVRTVRDLQSAASFDAVVTFDFNDDDDTQYLVEPVSANHGRLEYRVTCRDRHDVGRSSTWASQNEAIRDAVKAFMNN